MRLRLRLVLASLGAVTALLVPAAASAAVNPSAGPTIDPSIATYSHMQLCSTATRPRSSSGSLFTLPARTTSTAG
jgi:hypothetical protein